LARIAVLGAGAVGGFVGARLALSGHAVTLIGRPALVQGVTAQGMRLDMDGQTLRAPVTVTTDPAAVTGCDWVLIAVKSGDTETAAQAVAPHLSAGTTVLSLQNGIGNLPILTRTLPGPVLPALVYVAVSQIAPGHVQHKGGGRIVIGNGPNAPAAALLFSNAGFQTEISDQAELALWIKLTVNCTLNAVSALTGQPYGRILAQPGAEATLRAITAECRAVARASGIPLPDDIAEQALALTRSMPDQCSSTAQDLAAGKPTEIAHINGEIARRGAALGIPTPLNTALATLVALREN
tara:strand:- start:7169 stop:8056 length:888 start_codon:yes stop_codon:yes gene_type:complete